MGKLQLAFNTEENTLIVSDKEKVEWFGLTVMYTKENSSMVIDTGRVQ